MTSAVTAVTGFCVEQGLEHEVEGSSVVVTVPGTARQRVTVALTAGDKYLRIDAFVARRPDENHEAVYRWLLEQNARLLLVSFRIDSFGDVYLGGTMPVGLVDEKFLDSVLGVVVSTVDASFNVILELGFRGAIEREWAWRTSRGLDTRNLTAFTHLFDNGGQPPRQ